jgi:hypothetical protein
MDAKETRGRHARIRAERMAKHIKEYAGPNHSPRSVAARGTMEWCATALVPRS